MDIKEEEIIAIVKEMGIEIDSATITEENNDYCDYRVNIKGATTSPFVLMEIESKLEDETYLLTGEYKSFHIVAN